jgi:hypothetical protein
MKTMRAKSRAGHDPARRALLGVGVVLACGPWAASAWGASAATSGAPAELASILPGARLQGEGRMRVFGLHVYDARLWVAGQAVPPADPGWAEVPKALEVVYARKLVGGQIAERSLQEMRRQGDIAEPDAKRWLEAMKRLFPDVAAGDRLTGVNLPGRGARFFFNGTARGDVDDPVFARMFFGIWLSPRTSAPALRAALLGDAR